MITTQIEETVLDTAASKKSGWILFAVCILGVMIQIDFTAVNVALIAIGHAVNADLSTVQWALSAYVLAWGAFVLTAGRCADLFGKRRTFLMGTLLFMLGSALTGLAVHAWFLILGRVIQGIGGALFLPGLYTLVFTAFPENKRGFALGILTSAIAIGLAIGPTFGGVVLQLLNWRWIFFLNLPLGIPVIAIILWSVKREPLRLSHEPMDYIGACLIAIALVILMVALNQINAWGIVSLKFWAAIGVSLIFLGIFIGFEHRQQYPLIQFEMFRNRIFLGCMLNQAIMGFNFATILIIGGLYLENALNYSAFNAGFIFLIMTAMFAWLSVYSGKLVDRMDARVPILSGGIATMIALLIFAACTQHSPLWMPMLALALFGVGGGLSFPALNVTMMRSISPDLLSTASSAFAMFGCIGNTLGLIFSSAIIIAFGQRQLTTLLTTQAWRINASQTAVLHAVMNTPHYNAAQLHAFPTENIPHLLDTLRSAFVHGISVNMLLTTGLTIAGLIISAMMIRPSSTQPK